MGEQNAERGKVLSFAQGEDFFERRGLRQIQEGNFVDALQTYQHLLKLAPNNTRYLMDTAWLYAQMGYFDISNIFLLRIVNIERPVRAEVLQALGSNLYALSELRLSYSFLQRALEIAEDDEETAESSFILETLDAYFQDPSLPPYPPQYSVLHQAFLGSLNEDSDNPAHFPPLMGLVLASRGDVECTPIQMIIGMSMESSLQEIRHMMHALEPSPEDDYRLTAVYAALLKRGHKPNEAKPLLDALADMQSEYEDEMVCGACALYLYGRYKEALQLLEQVECQQSDGHIVDQLTALTLYGDGQYSQAQHIWEEMARMLPWDAAPRYYARLAADAAAGQALPQQLELTLDLPRHERLLRRELLLDRLERLKHDEELTVDSALWDAARWAVYQQDTYMLICGLMVLKILAPEEALRALRFRLYDRLLPHTLKPELADLLWSLQPGEMVITLSFRDFDRFWKPASGDRRVDALPEKQKMIFDDARQIHFFREERDDLKGLADAWLDMVGRPDFVPRNSTKPRPWVFALLYLYYFRRNGAAPDVAELAAACYVPVITANKTVKKLQKEGCLDETSAD